MATEERVIIPDFPDYEVTSYGRVISLRTGKDMRQTVVTGGDLAVGLTRDHKQYRRSVKVLVANAFVHNPYPQPDVYDYEVDMAVWDTPVILDGDEFHLHADNLVWRPRWFAIAYRKQIWNPSDVYLAGPVIEDSTGVEFKSVLDAAMERGSLPSEIILSMTNNDPQPRVFPNKERYHVK